MLAAFAAAGFTFGLALFALALGAFFFVGGMHGINACADNCTGHLGRTADHSGPCTNDGTGDAAR